MATLQEQNAQIARERSCKGINLERQRFVENPDTSEAEDNDLMDPAQSRKNSKRIPLSTFNGWVPEENLLMLVRPLPKKKRAKSNPKSSSSSSSSSTTTTKCSYCGLGQGEGNSSLTLLKCRHPQKCHRGNFVHHLCGVEFVEASDYIKNDDTRSYYCKDCNHSINLHNIYNNALTDSSAVEAMKLVSQYRTEHMS